MRYSIRLKNIYYLAQNVKNLSAVSKCGRNPFWGIILKTEFWKGMGQESVCSEFYAAELCNFF